MASAAGRPARQSTAALPPDVTLQPRTVNIPNIVVPGKYAKLKVSDWRIPSSLRRRPAGEDVAVKANPARVRFLDTAHFLDSEGRCGPNFGPPHIVDHPYDYGPRSPKRETISKIDVSTDQGLKWIEAKPLSTVHAKTAETLKTLWCERNVSLDRNCCGLLAAEKIIDRAPKLFPQENKRVVVAPLGLPLNQYFKKVIESKSLLSPIETWMAENSLHRQRCHIDLREDRICLTMARLCLDLLRYVECCHYSGYCNLDLSPDNVMIVCRRPECFSACYRLMLMSLDFDTARKLTYDTVLPYAPAQLTQQEQIIMSRSKSLTNLAEMPIGKEGWFSGRAQGVGFIGRKIEELNNSLKTMRGGFLATMKRHYERLENAYYDPVVDDQFQAIGVLMMIVDSVDKYANYSHRAEQAWRDVASIIITYRAHAQGDADWHGQKYVSSGALLDLHATERYLTESVHCAKLWKLLCGRVWTLVTAEKRRLSRQNETTSGMCEDPLLREPNETTSGMCEDPPLRELNENMEVKRMLVAQKASRRWRIAKLATAFAGGAAVTAALHRRTQTQRATKPKSTPH